MLDEMAYLSIDMSALRLAFQYSNSLAAEVMDTTENIALQELSGMLPPTTPIGTYIDTYA
jgi:hypothetical protein